MIISKRERTLLRVLSSLVLLVAILSMLAGCSGLGVSGQVVGAQIQVGGFTIGVSGAFPTSSNPPPNQP